MDFPMLLTGLALLFVGYIIGTIRAGYAHGRRLARFEHDLACQLDVQGADGNWNYDPYMHGLYNGLAIAFQNLTDRCYLRTAPVEWVRDRRLQQRKGEQVRELEQTQ